MAAATSKMERFVVIVNGFQPLIIITKRSILDVAVALDLHLKILFTYFHWQNFVISNLFFNRFLWAEVFKYYVEVLFFAYLFNVVFMDIFYHNSPIYREILL